MAFLRLAEFYMVNIIPSYIYMQYIIIFLSVSIPQSRKLSQSMLLLFNISIIRCICIVSLATLTSCQCPHKHKTLMLAAMLMHGMDCFCRSSSISTSIYNFLIIFLMLPILVTFNKRGLLTSLKSLRLQKMAFFAFED